MSELDLAWEDVLRRARRRRPRGRLVLVAALAAAALGGAPALAVLLTRPTGAHLPQGADRADVAVVLQPSTGRIIVEVAPWRGHRGICYLLLQREDGCSTWSPHGAYFSSGTPGGYTFDGRVTSVTAQFGHGTTMSLKLHRFPRLHVTFFTAARFHAFVRGYTLRGENGVVIARVHLPQRH